MTHQSKGTFTIQRWDEETFSEVDGAPTLRKAHIDKVYKGDIHGLGAVEYLFFYRNKTSAQIYGLERFSGSVGEKEGTFVFEHRGHFENGVTELTWTILDGTGTHDLKGISGHVEFKSGDQEEYPIVLEHHLKKEHQLWNKLISKTRN